MLSGIFANILLAQESFVTTGGQAKGSGGSANYSLGQLLLTTNISKTGSVSHGVQQPYEVSIVAGIDDKNAITLGCMVYPNPTADYLKLKIIDSALNLKSISIELSDMNGKILENLNIDDFETSISMQNYLSGTYFLKIILNKNKSNNLAIKTLKIVKI